jgi:hypothetical protein
VIIDQYHRIARIQHHPYSINRRVQSIKFELEWLGDQSDCKGPLCASSLGYGGSHATARLAAHSSEYKNNIRLAK